MAGRHLNGIVADAAHWPTMVRRGATHTRDINKPFRTGRATHRAPAHRAPGPLALARARVAVGSSWDHHFVKAFIERPEPFCDSCGGPYDGWLLQYGGHWDTCPNRVMA